MKIREIVIFSLYLLISHLIPSELYSQIRNPDAFIISETNSQARTFLCEEDRAKILEEIENSISKLKSQDKLNTVNFKKINSEYFAWPLRPAANLTDPGYYVISGYVDHDPDFPGNLLDYNGGTRTYDTEIGYNHQGTDFAAWPFSWYKMDYDQVEIISMAPGIIVGKSDGHFDRSCAMSDSAWNAVYVLHDNGAIALYGHMKKNSLTTKVEGDSVETGEYLGLMGSSGSSTGPHLHLEIYDENENLIDPWAGSSNPTTESSWWLNQPPYYDSQVLNLSTHFDWPKYPECPQQEILNLKDEFTYNDTMLFVTNYRDVLRGQTANYEIKTPDGLTYWSWDFAIPEGEQYADYYSAAYWGWFFQIPGNAPLGQWEGSVFYENVLYRTYFTVTNHPTGNERNTNLPNNFHLSQNYPNPFNPSTKISFNIPESAGNSSTIRTKLQIYDIAGRLVQTLVDEKKSPGFYTVYFNGGNLVSGTYFYTLSAGNYLVTKKMTLLK